MKQLPLAITVIRFFLGPAFMVLYVAEGASVLLRAGLFGIVVLSIFSDWLDGYAARRLDAVSTAGKLLDPFADALFCMLVFATFAWRGRMPGSWWVVGVLIGREAVMTFFLRPFALRRGVVVAARMVGKVKTSFQFGLMITLLVRDFPEGWPLVLELLRTLARFLAPLGSGIVVVLSVGSLVLYIRDISRALKTQGAKSGA